jgi:dihydrofolate reductase
MSPPITLIAALDEDRAIGRQGQLPWRLPEDMRRFRARTMGRPLILGRATWESIGQPLPGRHLIVLTRQAGYVSNAFQSARSPSEALSLALSMSPPEVMIAGGQQVYEAFLPWATRMSLTRVHTRVEGADTWFPSWEEASWRVVHQEEHPTDARHAHAMTFLDLERR